MKGRRYLDLPEARRVYRAGGNVTEYLKHQRGEAYNSQEIIEIAYDLQAGSYVAEAASNLAALREYAAEIGAVVSTHSAGAETFLDVGTGELTTLSFLSAHLRAQRLLAFDISWSRLRCGLEFAAQWMPAEHRAPLRLFVADMAEIPLPADSVDVVLSHHALEPNGGREERLLQELFRVARHKLVLCEPSYEHNTDEGRARMDRLGYVRDLAGVATKLGGRVIDVVPIRRTTNPLNPTHAFVLEPPLSNASAAVDSYSDPGAETLLKRLPDCFFSPSRGLAYPVLQGIPLLTAERGFLASALDEFEA